MIAFMHIPRTGGTSFQSWAERTYNGSYIRGPGPILGRRHKQLLQAQIDDVKCYAVHMAYDPNISGLRWMTLLREPIDRIVSHFYFRVKREHPDYVDLNIWDITNDNDWPEHDCGHNLMVRMLAGGIDSFATAKEYVKQFAIIGRVERIQSFSDKYSKLSTCQCNITKENDNPCRPMLTDIPTACLDWLREHNQKDIQLMQYLEQEGMIA